MLTISQKRFFVSLDELALLVETDIKQGGKTGIRHPWKLGLRTKYFWKNLKSASSFRLTDLILAMTVSFSGMKLTLHKSQVHSYNVVQ